MSFDSPFSDPAWVAIELYARVVDPLQLILEEKLEERAAAGEETSPLKKRSVLAVLKLCQQRN